MALDRNFQQPYNFPTKNGDDGDALLWAGLMHASGENHAEGILACQDNSGRFWRSPARVGGSDPNSFSRDMATGLMVAAMADSFKSERSEIVEALQRWVNYVVANGYKACPSTDGRGFMTPTIFWVCSHIGVKVPLIFRLTRFLLYPYLYVAVKTGRPGYGLHLMGVILFTLQFLGGSTVNKYVSSCLYKKQPKNPFFAYLAGDYNSAADMTYKYYINSLYNNQGYKNQWGWERDQEEMAWKDSCGHDFVFMSNLMTSTLDANVKVNSKIV